MCWGPFEWRVLAEQGVEVGDRVGEVGDVAAEVREGSDDLAYFFDVFGGLDFAEAADFPGAWTDGALRDDVAEELFSFLEEG